MHHTGYAGTWRTGKAMKHATKSETEARPAGELKVVRGEYQPPRLRKAARLSAVTAVAPVLSGIPIT